MLPAPGAALCCAAGQHPRTPPTPRLSCAQNFKEQPQPSSLLGQRGVLKSIDAETNCQGSSPKSATYSTHVNFIIINNILKREMRLLQSKKEII